VIRVPFVEPADPLWVRWKARAEAAQDAHGPGAEVKDGIIQGIRDWLLKAYSGKCAYCELTIAGHSVRVDHFRPKKGVKRRDGVEVALRSKAGPHPGYHWLAYDWRNFLPSCERCNLSKSNHFHTRDEWWAERSEELGTEKPLLVNPSAEDPGGLLMFKKDGFVYPGAPGDARARYVIDILKLNREELREARAEAWTDAEEQMDTLLLRFVQHDRLELFEHVVANIEAVEDGRAEFSAMKRLAIAAGRVELTRRVEEQQRRSDRLAAKLTPQPRSPSP